MSNKSTTMNNKCSRKQDHDWEVEKKTNTHIIKVCKKCKGHMWTCRRID